MLLISCLRKFSFLEVSFLYTFIFVYKSCKCLYLASVPVESNFCIYLLDYPLPLICNSTTKIHLFYLCMCLLHDSVTLLYLLYSVMFLISILRQVSNKWYCAGVIPLKAHFILPFQNDLSIFNICSSSLWNLKSLCQV